METADDPVAKVMRQVAHEELLARFQNLQEHEILKKGSRDIVTVADLEAELRLKRELKALYPDHLFIGEEKAEAEPEILEALKAGGPAIIVDPLDGTRNYSKGIPSFAMIVAEIIGGETVRGWILDPIQDMLVTAVKGRGAWASGRRLHMTPPQTLEHATGSLGHGIKARLDTRKAEGEGDLPGQVVRYHCVGKEYMDLALGKLNFALYGGRLMAWDHAAGVLIVEEAGGIAALMEDHSAYTPTHPQHGKHLLLGSDKNTWQALHTVLKPH